jgi:hypothetical protein
VSGTVLSLERYPALTERFVITNEVQFAEALLLEQKGWLTLWLCVPESTSIGELKGKKTAFCRIQA